ncbi:MAG: protein-L-isoaspartate(D-aspartate) O-methyltransferase [SAR86 cluster bacterium]|jgi:protein-L-isoaspartate(D-aspartate) O-methyltransferase|nr:protein-L-isoaspartate(D-aspartate) O-methyltransferase [SAR86 cluster bacterium]
MSPIEKELGIGMTSLRTRKRLVERLTEKGIKDVRVLEAIRDVPRHLFVDEALASRAYEDLSLPIGFQQTISQPYIVAKMTEALISHDLFTQKPFKKVLEIGTGCGYQSAILSRFTDQLVSIERIRGLYIKARNNLRELKIRNVESRFGDALETIKEIEIYDAILAAAVSDEIPEKLINQLKTGGRMVLPVKDANSQKLRLILKVNKNQVKIKELDDVAFVPLVRGTLD